MSAVQRTIVRLLSIAVVAVCPVAGQRSVTVPAESAGWDAVTTGLLSVFDRADVVMLGEAHGRKVDAELRVRLVRRPDFAKNVHFIILEAAAQSQQPALDRYIRGDEITDADRESLRAIGVLFQEMLAAIRDVNRMLAPA